MSSIVDGVLLARNGPVHRLLEDDLLRGHRPGRTCCGTYVVLDRVVAVSAIQAAAYRLPVCPKCYPTNHDSMRGVRTW